MNDKEKLKGIKDAIRKVISYPKNGVDSRRTSDGFPSEFCYDEYAYKRMVRSYRTALQEILKEFK